MSGAEKLADELPQGVERGRGVDARAQMRSVLESFRVPRGERAELVDYPAIVRGRARFIDALQAHVVFREEVFGLGAG